jgi:hypothetical protein
MPVTVKIEGMERLKKIFGRDWKGVFQAGCLAAGKEIAAKLEVYPPQRRGESMEFVSDRQRRGFFAKLRAGEIEVPYRRTGTLGRKWMTRALGPGRVGAVVGNPTPYGPFVQSEERQAPIHRGTGWPTDVQVVEQAKSEGLIEKAMQAAVEGALKK